MALNLTPLTAAEVARQIDMTPRAVRNWLAGRFGPSLQAQARLNAAGILLPRRPGAFKLSTPRPGAPSA
jgi:hypothetical protein